MNFPLALIFPFSMLSLTSVWVMHLQQALEIRVDGKFGPATEFALKARQAENGLEVDGIAGRSTYRSLELLT